MIIIVYTVPILILLASYFPAFKSLASCHYSCQSDVFEVSVRCCSYIIQTQLVRPQCHSDTLKPSGSVLDHDY